MEKVCKKHREKPAIMYGRCIGCELEELRRELELTKMEMEMKVKSLNQANEFLIDRCKELEKKLAE